MAIYVLDTTTVTHLQHAHPRVVARLASYAASHQVIGTSTVTVEESVGGWLAELRRARTRADVASAAEGLADAVTILSRLRIFPTTEPTLDQFDALVKLKLNVGRPDLKIAAVALDLGAAVVTDNLRDFGRVPHLAVENWLA
jgi:tRNA(fMet)-specific endonuclease VapC